MEFEDEIVVPLAPAEAFDLALSIDAHKGSMVRSRERAVAGVTTGVIALGEFVTWRARHFGITWTMTSVITELDRPVRFVDEQRRGPFHSFWHEHTFVAIEGGTLMRDRVRFAAPLGFVGRFMEWAVLGRYLRHLIHVRNEFLATEAQRR